MNVREALDNIYKEFEKTYEEAKKEGYLDGQANKYEFAEKFREEGMNLAWECARSVVDSKVPFEFWELASGQSTLEVFKRYSAKEAIEKIREYEEKQKEADEIKIGDILESPVNRYKYIALRVNTDGYVICVDQYGRISARHKDGFKIIEHNPQIENVFEKIRED